MSWINPHAKTDAWLERDRKQKAEREKALKEERETKQLRRENKERTRSRKWLDQCQKLADIIKKEREIKQTDLIERSEIGFPSFLKLKPHFLEMNPDIIYNKKEKKYFFNNNNNNKVSLSFSDES
jgi:hypothetical protein